MIWMKYQIALQVLVVRTGVKIQKIFVAKQGLPQQFPGNKLQFSSNPPAKTAAPIPIPPLDKLRITSELSTDPDGISFNAPAEYDIKKLRKRARAKYFNNVLAVKLGNLPSPLKDKYWDTYYCSSQVTKEGDQVRSFFCKHRHCLICNRIRTAQLIHRYLPTIRTWPHKVFLTLTVKNPPAEKLVDTMEWMHQAFTQIKDSERKAGRKLIGIRKYETTYNRRENSYHPHFHFILSDDASVDHIIFKWLKKCNPHIKPKEIKRLQSALKDKIEKGFDPKQYIRLNDDLEEMRRSLIADPQFQNCKPADDDACFELFKYFTKLTSNSCKDNKVSVKALDQIYQSIMGRRIFQPFGFVAHEEIPAPENIQITKEDADIITYQWLDEHCDWMDLESGDLLSGYVPTEWDCDKRKLVR